MSEASEFMSFRRAAVLLGAYPKQVSELVRRGVLSTRRLPGGRPQVFRSEVLRLARESVCPGSMAETAELGGQSQ